MLTLYRAFATLTCWWFFSWIANLVYGTHALEEPNPPASRGRGIVSAREHFVVIVQTCNSQVFYLLHRVYLPITLGFSFTLGLFIYSPGCVYLPILLGLFYTGSLSFTLGLFTYYTGSTNLLHWVYLPITLGLFTYYIGYLQWVYLLIPLGLYWVSLLHCSWVFLTITLGLLTYYTGSIYLLHWVSTPGLFTYSPGSILGLSFTLQEKIFLLFGAPHKNTTWGWSPKTNESTQLLMSPK